VTRSIVRESVIVSVDVMFVTPPSVIASATTGRPLKLHTYHLVREDQQALYGFRTVEELGFFNLLLTVTGVGPKVALAIVGSRPTPDLQLAIMQQDQAVLVSIPGIGKRLAERVIFELKEKVAAVEVVDPFRVRFRLKEPWPDFMTFYATPASGAGWIVPKKYVEKVGEEGFKKAPVGAGPYRLVSFNPGVELVAEAFEGYWRKEPQVKRLVFKVMPDDTTRGAALKRGDVDIIFQVNGPVAQDLRRTPHVRIVSRAGGNGVFWLDLPDQWDPKSPWHDKRVRQAASLALDRQAVNQAESLGNSRLTGSIIPRSFEFALPFDPAPYEPGKAKQFLAEAGYPNGFDAGDFYPYPPLYAMGEALAGYLGAVGIRTRIRTMERAAFLTAWREKKLKGVLMGLNGAGGNAATRLEAYVTRTGIYAYGVLPEVEDLFQRQAREIDRTRREALLHQIQRILHERVMHVPVYELSPMAGIGPRVEQAGVGLIPGFPYSAPYEDVKLKKP